MASTERAGNRGDFRSLFWPKDSRQRLRRIAFSLLFILFLAIPWPGLFYGLRVKKGGSGQELLTLPFLLHHSFSLSYTHSLYLVPVVEKFEAKGSAIHLREISTKKYGIAEYYNIPHTLHLEKGEVHMRDIQFTQPELLVTIAFTETQRLTWKDRVYALYEMSRPGEVLIIQARSISPARYLCQKAIN